MNVYKELVEVSDFKDKLKELTDRVLDLYKNSPIECTEILMDINDIDEELTDLRKEFNKFL